MAMTNGQRSFAGGQSFNVYRQLNTANCIIVPEGNLVPAIFYHVHGPATHADCEAWKQKNCV